jgi:hypothetical protein
MGFLRISNFLKIKNPIEHHEKLFYNFFGQGGSVSLPDAGSRRVIF